jgi:hypothetical protein
MQPLSPNILPLGYANARPTRRSLRSPQYNPLYLTSDTPILRLVPGSA